jgi:hypothetical protein
LEKLRLVLQTCQAALERINYGVLTAVKSNDSCPKLLKIPECAQVQQSSDPQFRLFCVISLTNKTELKIEPICWLSHPAAHFRAMLSRGYNRRGKSENIQLRNSKDLPIHKHSVQFYACLLRTSFLVLRHFAYIYYVYNALPETATPLINMAAQFPVPVKIR